MTMHASAAELLKDRAELVAGQLALMGNPRRLLILCHLVDGECAVGDLRDVTGLSQSALSQHLSRLRAAGMVATRRDGQMKYYRIADPNVGKVMRVLYDIYCQMD